MKGLILAALMLLPVTVVTAAGPVRVLSFGVGSATPESMPMPGVFGNRTEKITLSIDGAVAEPASLRAHLLQVAGQLAMPMSKDLPLLDGITFPNGSPQTLTASIKLPDVKRRTEILVRLMLVPNSAQGSPLKDIQLAVFPETVTKELADLLKQKPDGAAQVVVFGPGQKLRRFLSSQHVTFEDGGQGTPDRFDSNRFYFGELSSGDQFRQAQDHGTGARVALFFNDETLPPGIYANTSSAGNLVSVSLPMLDNLADDPLDQLALIKIIHQLSANSTSAN